MTVGFKPAGHHCWWGLVGGFLAYTTACILRLPVPRSPPPRSTRTKPTDTCVPLHARTQDTGRSTPVVGKHTKAVTCGAWNSDNVLVLGAKDKQISLSSDDGTTITNLILQHSPLDVQVSDCRHGALHWEGNGVGGSAGG